MTHLSLEVVLELQKVPALAIWDRLYSSHRSYLDGIGEVDFGGKFCRARDVAKRIERSDRPHFSVVWSDDQRLEYGHITNCDLSLVRIVGCVRPEENAEEWLAPFLGLEEFRQARLLDEEYDFWQNAADPLQYETRGRSYEGLPMKSNGLPPPLEQMIIDTSRNPGRRIIRRGFIEAVGSLMWLGGAFWQITGADQKILCSQKWLRCDAWLEGVIRIRAAETPFTTSDGSVGELQEQLRKLLYTKVS